MIKKNKPLKQYFGRALKHVGLACLTCSIFVAGCQVAKPQNEYNLPTQEKIMERLLKIYGDESNFFLLDEKPVRRPFKENESIMLNMLFDVAEFQKPFFEDCVEELNSVFDVINPNYHFEIEYSPKEEDLNSPYGIDVQLATDTSAPPYLNIFNMGKARSLLSERTEDIEGREIYNSTIYLYHSLLNDMRTLTKVFKHEFLHTLGLGDAYLNPNATQNTIMQVSSDDSLTHLSPYDVATLDALYRSSDNTKTESEINDFIQSYNETNVHTPNHVNAKQFKDKVKNIDISNLKEWAKEEDSLGENFLSFIENLNSLENFDQDFGKDFSQFTPLSQKCNLVISDFNHFNVTSNEMEIAIYSGKTFDEDKINSVNLETVTIDGFVYAPRVNFAFIKIEDFVFCLRPNLKTYEISTTHYVLEKTNLSAEEFFESQFENTAKKQSFQNISGKTATQELSK